MEAKIDLQSEIIVDNATQRTVSVIGGKGTGKTTLLMMLLKQESPVLTFDPLSVIKAESIEATRINLRVKDIDPERIAVLMKMTNATLKKGKNIIFAFDNMIQEEEIALSNLTLPSLNHKNGYVFFDEIHEFVPLHSQSLEVERYVRHCRNKNVGIVMTSQRPASVHKNVLALTDYLVLFRVTWAHDLKAVRELLKDVLEKDEVKRIVGSLPRLGFMEGYVIDYRAEGEGKNEDK